MESALHKIEELAVFDVCDTLYYSNTTHDFIAFVVFGPGYNSFLRFTYLLIFGRLSPVRYALIGISVLSGSDIPRTLGLRFLRGYTSLELDKAADSFTSSFLTNVKVVQTQRMLNELREAGSRVILCSSSIEPVVRAIAREQGDVDAIGSPLVFRNGTFSGKIAEDTAGRKLEFLKASYPDAKIEYAVSDNLSDVVLLKAAAKAFAVVHNSAKLSFWKQYEFEIVDLRV